MIPEFIKKQREKTFYECRRLLIKINGSIQDESQESASPDKAQNPEDNGQRYNICDCCQRSDIPNEKMTHIESGQQLCPVCLKAFQEAAQNTPNLIC